MHTQTHLYIDTSHTETCSLNASIPSWQKSTRNVLRASTDPIQTHTPEFRLFQFLGNKKVVQRTTWHISLKTLFFSPHSQIFGTDFLRSHCSIETTHQHLLTRACRPRRAFFSAVFLTHPSPESGLRSREITAFCHLACQSLALADRRWTCQAGESFYSERGGTNKQKT